MSIASADVDAMIDRIRDLVISGGYALGRAPDGMSWFLDSIPGGEIRNTLSLDDNGLLLTQVQRAETEQDLVFATPLLADMEKFLTYYFCGSLREDKLLPLLLVVPIPVTIDKVAPGYTITKADGPRYELHHGDESIIRRGSVIDLVKFSHYVALTPDELRESALDPEGKPHFMVWQDS